MVRKILRQRVVLYAIVGLLPLSVSFATFNALLQLGAPVQTANMIGIAIGGQVSFWSHDRLTFGDRHVSVRGWTLRWARFMPGQAGGFLINSLAAGLLAWMNVSAMTVFVGALAVSGGATFSWNNWVSHRTHYSPRHRA